jgi:uncharacterized GH25 family protein
MRCPNKLRSLASGLCGCLALTCIFTQPVCAHDFWIEPEQFITAPQALIDVRLREGVGFEGNTLPFIDEWFRDFSLVNSAGRSPVSGTPGDDPAAQIIIASGQTLLGYQSTRNFVELNATKFNKYLADEGIAFIREERRKRGEDNAPAPEYFVRCAKALLQSSESGVAVYDVELGYTLELIPITNPYSLGAGDTLEFKLLFRGEPIEGFQLQAFTREQPELQQKIRTDKQGKAEIQLTSAGIWLVKAVQIEPIIGDPKAHWQSYWATYLFEVK